MNQTIFNTKQTPIKQYLSIRDSNGFSPMGNKSTAPNTGIKPLNIEQDISMDHDDPANCMVELSEFDFYNHDNDSNNQSKSNLGQEQDQDCFYDQRRPHHEEIITVRAEDMIRLA
jgi:hypothetical protein